MRAGAPPHLLRVRVPRAAGAPGTRIFFLHLLPNTLGPVIVAATSGIPAAIFAEAALSYIGIGIGPPTRRAE